MTNVTTDRTILTERNMYHSQNLELKLKLKISLGKIELSQLDLGLDHPRDTHQRKEVPEALRFGYQTIIVLTISLTHQ